MKFHNLFPIALLTLLTLSCGKSMEDAPAQPVMRFTDGEFKIVQFTDLHLKPYDTTTDTTFATVRAIIDIEKPDIAVLTGDVVCYDPATDGWNHLVQLFDSIRQPFTVTMGNHDAEYLPKDSIYSLLMKSPFYVGDKGPADIHGCGNTVIPVYGSSGTPAALVYCIDSNDYQPNQKLGYYDWIHFDQVKWYREMSDSFAVANNGTHLPAIAFFHIPVPEFANVLDDDKTYGAMHEGAGASAALNAGLFASMAEIGDVMGIFVGHDHNNDFVGMTRDIAVGFGRCTGAMAYGDLTRGARVIRLYEGDKKFDTWVTTPLGPEPAWYYPSGINGLDELSMEYLPAVEHCDTTHGIRYRYYEGRYKHTSHIKDSDLVNEGTMSNFKINDDPDVDHFAYRFNTRLYIPERGVYRFYTYTDDGSVLSIDGVGIVNNDGGHNVRRREGKVALEKGFHNLDLVYFEDYMGQHIEVGLSSRDIAESVIPDSLLYLPE